MKRTRLFRQAKGASSAVPVEHTIAAKTDSSEEQPNVATNGKSKLSFANLISYREYIVSRVQIYIIVYNDTLNCIALYFNVFICQQVKTQKKILPKLQGIGN